MLVNGSHDDGLNIDLVALAPRVVRWEPTAHSRCAPSERRKAAALLRSVAFSRSLVVDLALDRLIPMVVRDFEERWRASARFEDEWRSATAVAVSLKTRCIAMGTRGGKVAFKPLSLLSAEAK